MFKLFKTNRLLEIYQLSIIKMGISLIRKYYQKIFQQLHLNFVRVKKFVFLLVISATKIEEARGTRRLRKQEELEDL